MEKVIFHVDVNSAYLSWEAVYRRKYREKFWICGIFLPRWEGM